MSANGDSAAFWVMGMVSRGHGVREHGESSAVGDLGSLEMVRVLHSWI